MVPAELLCQPLSLSTEPFSLKTICPHFYAEEQLICQQWFQANQKADSGQHVPPHSSDSSLNCLSLLFSLQMTQSEDKVKSQMEPDLKVPGLDLSLMLRQTPLSWAFCPPVIHKGFINFETGKKTLHVMKNSLNSALYYLLMIFIPFISFYKISSEEGKVLKYHSNSKQIKENCMVNYISHPPEMFLFLAPKWLQENNVFLNSILLCD